MISVNADGDESLNFSKSRLKQLETSGLLFHLAISNELALVLIRGRLVSPNTENTVLLALVASDPLLERTCFNSFIKKKISILFLFIKNLKNRANLQVYENFYYMRLSIVLLKISKKIRCDFLGGTLQ